MRLFFTAILIIVYSKQKYYNNIFVYMYPVMKYYICFY